MDAFDIAIEVFIVLMLIAIWGYMYYTEVKIHKEHQKSREQKKIQYLKFNIWDKMKKQQEKYFSL